MQPTDTQIIDALIAKDEKMTHDFFFAWCRPLLYSIIRKVFNYEVDYDELVNELYIYLLEKDGRRLRTFQGRSSIFLWLKCVATRFFLEKRDGGAVIEDASSEPLYPIDEPTFEPLEKEAIKQDVRRLLELMHNPRNRMVLKRIMIDDVDYEELAVEMNTSVANLYNIKRRALVELTAIALKEFENGEK